MQVKPEELKIIKTILQMIVPDYAVRAFGSRVHGERMKPFSDLDLVVMTKKPLDLNVLADLKEALSASSLSFRVDVIDWSRTEDRFRAIISQHSEPIYEPNNA